MREVRSTEAKTHLPQLLRAVEHGESVAITRHGRRVAHLVPARAEDRASRKRAVERFRRRRAGWKHVDLSTEEILTSLHEGHRL